MALVAAQASLEQMVTSSRQRTASPRAVPQSFGKTIDAIRSGATFAARLVSLVGLAARRLGRPAGFVTRAVGTSASVWEVAGPLIAHLADLRARLRTSLMAAHRWAARSAAEIVRRRVTLALELLTGVRRTLPLLASCAGILGLAILAATIMSPRSPADRLPADITATPQPTRTSVSG